MLNLKQIKHAYSKDNVACINAIIPAVLNYVGTKYLKPSMKLAEKLKVLEDEIVRFSEMLTSFI